MPLELVAIATDTYPLDGLRWSMIHTERALNPPEDACELRSRTNPPPHLHDWSQLPAWRMGAFRFVRFVRETDRLRAD
jgi:hypothetical protein